MSEIALGLAYLKSTLTGDAILAGYAPGGIRRGMATPQAPAPYITIKHQDNGMDAPVFGGGRAYSGVYFEVKVWGPASGTQALINGADRIDTLISTAIPVAVSGGTIKACFRSQPLQSDEDPDGEQWSYFGGVYFMFVTT